MTQISLIVLFLAGVPLLCSSQTRLTERAWTARELWGQSTSENLLFRNDSILLEDNLLIENDAKSIGSIRSVSWDTISSKVVFRKYLDLPVWPVKEAIIAMMVYPVFPGGAMSGGQLEFRINGNPPVVYEVRHFWTNVQVPGGYLKKGENLIEVTVHTRGAIFRTPMSVNLSSGSYRSADEGVTWGLSRGEYPIRVKVRCFHRRGVLQTPIINVAKAAAGGLLLSPCFVDWVKFRLDLRDSDGSKRIVRFRSGRTHEPEAGGWTEWQSLDGNSVPNRFLNRFIQFEFGFEKNTGGRSPVLNGFYIRSGWRIDSARGSCISLVSGINHRIVRQSLYFQHENPSLAALQKFRRKYQLDKVVEGTLTEWDKIKRIRGWVAGLWDWYLPNEELPDMVAWDGSEILDSANKRDKSHPIGGFCLYYAIVFAQACQSFGIPARIVTLNYSIWGGHEVAEVWSRDYEKWVMIDAQFDALFYDRKTRVPSSVLELHKIFLDTYYSGKDIVDRDKWTIEDRNRRSGSIDPGRLPIAMELGGNAHSGKLTGTYVWWKSVPDTAAPGYSGGYGFFNAAEVRWFPRSNWLSEPTPMPVTHGRTHWGWDGYLCWTDPKTPETPEHRHFIRRESDMYGRLFMVDFSAEKVVEGGLGIDMVTDSPGFQSFEIIANGNKIQLSQSTYLWKLRPGKNRLEVRSVDILGNRGPASKIVVDYLTKR